MFDALYLSPHFDDAVLSCGAQIWDRAQRGERVLVVTVCAAPPPPVADLSPYARSLHERWAEAGAYDRAAEDRLAVQHLGATPWHMSYADCIYRRGPSGKTFYNADEEIFGSVAPGDRLLAGEMGRRFRQFSRQLKRGAPVFAPFGLGNHVDHQLVKAAARVWSRTRRSPFHFYADYPYAASAGDGMEVPTSEAGRRQKVEAVRAYQSQLSTFWPNAAAMAESVSAWIERTF